MGGSLRTKLINSPTRQTKQTTSHIWKNMNHLSQEGGVTLDAEEINVPNKSMSTIQLSDRRNELLKVHHAQTHRWKHKLWPGVHLKERAKASVKTPSHKAAFRAMCLHQQINTVWEGEITLENGEESGEEALPLIQGGIVNPQATERSFHVLSFLMKQKIPSKIVANIPSYILSIYICICIESTRGVLTIYILSI